MLRSVDERNEFQSDACDSPSSRKSGGRSVLCLSRGAQSLQEPHLTHIPDRTPSLLRYKGKYAPLLRGPSQESRRMIL
ncbi:hypothetical protein AAFF_G00021590 [Aldrovandia affinis]|uniref:Uncharacterized protein n=1 Tax=Aldrovandia affinis TaxID=143900 RepID=A0AAD7WGC4_9TELE|nr:hypothetical protein AAFF_G00021590 [Aldrovandia affinis]